MTSLTGLGNGEARAGHPSHGLRRTLLYARNQVEGMFSGLRSSRLGAGLFVTLLLLGCFAFIYATGGSAYPYLHVIYLPIALSAFWFFAPGGLLAGLVAGVLLGPLLPLNVATGEMQSTFAWLFRTAAFMLLGLLVGHLSFQLSQRLHKLNGSLDNLASTYARTLKTFAALVALRDEQTGGHCERVAHNACRLGERLGLNEAQLEALYWAGVLHDLGKVATPASVLLKDGKLSAEEYAEVKKHAALGYDILMQVSPDFETIALGIRHHHERLDGSGYPDALAGEDIPIFGRILAVVDVFEALTSQRPYRGPVPADVALKHVQLNAGSHFDPDIVRLFTQLYQERLLYIAGEEHLSEEDLAGVLAEARAAEKPVALA